MTPRDHSFYREAICTHSLAGCNKFALKHLIELLGSLTILLGAFVTLASIPMAVQNTKNYRTLLEVFPKIFTSGDDEGRDFSRAEKPPRNPAALAAEEKSAENVHVRKPLAARPQR